MSRHLFDMSLRRTSGHKITKHTQTKSHDYTQNRNTQLETQINHIKFKKKWTQLGTLCMIDKIGHIHLDE